jgi:hypothetical protein
MKSLSRPMFRRGGGVSAKNNGIVSGFDNGGTVRQAFTSGTGPQGVQPVDTVSTLREFLQEPTRPQGLTTSDYLRIAAAGADIMGAQPTGRSGLIGALQAAGPSLGALGRDLGTSMGEREARYQDKLSDYKATLAQAAASDVASNVEFERQQNLLALEFENDANLLRQKLAVPQFEKQFVNEEAKRIRSEMKNLDEDSAEYQELKAELENNLYGSITKEIIAGKVDLLQDEDFMDSIADTVDALIQAGEPTKAGGKYENMTRDEITNKVILDAFVDYGLSGVFVPAGKAEGGRIGFAEGDRVTRAGDNEEKAAEDAAALARAIEQENKKKNFKFFVDKDGVLRRMPMRAGDNEEKAARDAIKMFSGPQQEVPGPQRFERAEGGAMTTMTDEPSPQKESPLTFEELRARLPMEVTDSVIRLLSSSEAALLDFANINTEQDIAVFNQKYNTDLQLPTQAV